MDVITNIESLKTPQYAQFLEFIENFSKDSLDIYNQLITYDPSNTLSIRMHQ